MNKNILAVCLLLVGGTSLPVFGYNYEDLQHFKETGYTECNGCDLSDLSFAYAYFKKGLSLRGTDLRGTNWTGVEAEDADFSHSDCSPSYGWWYDSVTCFDKANLSKSTMSDIDARNASFRGTNLELVEANGANFRDADLTDAYCRGMEAKDADFRGSRLKRAVFKAAELCRSRFERARMDHTDFRYADMRGATGSFDKHDAHFDFVAW